MQHADIRVVLEGVLAGERRSIARCLRWVDDLPALGRQITYSFRDKPKRARIIGITGNPGAGKSTVVDGLVRVLRQAKQTVAVLAVDPSSPFSGGAILGDRIRMHQHTNDGGVFIRSLATRGALGGLSRAAFDSVRVLDAAGYDVIVVETVGVGQDEVDIARLAETTVVVMVPGMGDDVQAIKAGILEIADVFLLNKSDKEGVADLERSLRNLLSLAPASEAWEPSFVRSVASKGEGLRELWGAIAQHQDYLAGPLGSQRRALRAAEVFDRLLDADLVEHGRARLGARLVLARQAVAKHGADPYAKVVELLKPTDNSAHSS